MPAADAVLRPARSCAVCITCQHFRYEVGRHCVTVLTCPIHQGLIPQGEHLTKRCAQWVARREVAVGWCPEAGRVEGEGARLNTFGNPPSSECEYLIFLGLMSD